MSDLTFNSALFGAVKYRVVSSANCIVRQSKAFGRSYKYKLNKVGPKMVPCPTPISTSTRSEVSLSILTACFLSLKYDLNRSTPLEDNPMLASLLNMIS